jgi:hypothetical protein
MDQRGGKMISRMGQKLMVLDEVLRHQGLQLYDFGDGTHIMPKINPTGEFLTVSFIAVWRKMDDKIKVLSIDVSTYDVMLDMDEMKRQIVEQFEDKGKVIAPGERFPESIRFK